MRICRENYGLELSADTGPPHATSDATRNCLVASHYRGSLDVGIKLRSFSQWMREQATDLETWRSLASRDNALTPLKRFWGMVV